MASGRCFNLCAADTLDGNVTVEFWIIIFAGRKYLGRLKTVLHRDGAIVLQCGKQVPECGYAAHQRSMPPMVIHAPLWVHGMAIPVGEYRLKKDMTIIRPSIQNAYCDGRILVYLESRPKVCPLGLFLVLQFKEKRRSLGSSEFGDIRAGLHRAASCARGESE